RLISAGWRNWPLRSYMARLLWLCLFAVIRVIRRGMLLRSLRRRRPLFRLRNVWLFTTRRRHGLRGSHPITLLRLCLFAMIRGIRRGMLVRSNLFRPLLLWMLVVARLLATGRRWGALTLLCLALTLSLFNCLPILFQN